MSRKYKEIYEDSINNRDQEVDANPTDGGVDSNIEDMIDMTEPEEDVACVPYDDQCPESQYCQYQDTRLMCVDEGDVPLDLSGNNPPCVENLCSRGMMCLSSALVDYGFGEGLKCYETCAPELIGQAGAGCDQVGCCTNGRHTCFPVVTPEGESLPFGVCHY